MVIAGLLFLFFLAIYSFGVSPTVFGGDSGEIILSYFYAGIPHPPGYPLNTVLGWILTRLPIEGTFAYRANFVSAIYSSIACGLLFILFFKLTRDRILAILTAGVLGFAPLFWLYAHIAEVFQLASILVLTSLIFLFSWISSTIGKKSNLKLLYLAIFFAGLSVFDHQTTLLLAPAYLYILYKKRKFFNFKVGIRTLGVFFLGIIPYVFFLWAAANPTPINWENPANARGFLSLLTRAEYGSFSATPGLIGVSSTARLLQVLWWAKVVLADFTAIGIVTLVLGLSYLFVRRRELFWFFLLALFFTGPFFLFYASFPPTITFLQGIIERFLLINYIFVAILIGFGLLAAVDLSQRLFVARARVLYMAPIILKLSFLLVILVLAYINFPKADLSKFKIGGVFAADILAGADPPGVLFLQGDTATFNSEYKYYAEGENPQTKLVLIGRLRRPFYRASFMAGNPDLVYDDVFASNQLTDTDSPFKSLIEKNYGKLPFWAFEVVPAPEGYNWIQEGVLKKLYRKDEVPSAAELVFRIEEKTQKIKYNPDIIRGQYLQLLPNHILTHYSSIYAQNGFELLRVSKFAESEKYFKLAIDSDSENKSAFFGLGAAAFEQKKCQESEEAFLKVYSLDANYWQALEGLVRVYGECFSDNAKKEEYLQKLAELKIRLSEGF